VRVKEDRKILRAIKRRVTGLVRSGVGTAIYNTLLKERKREEVAGRRERRRKRDLDNLKDRREC
jgi:hypothetical protein